MRASRVLDNDTSDAQLARLALPERVPTIAQANAVRVQMQLGTIFGGVMQFNWRMQHFTRTNN